MFTLTVFVLLASGAIWQGDREDKFTTEKECHEQFEQDKHLFMAPGAFTQDEKPLLVLQIDHLCNVAGTDI